MIYASDDKLQQPTALKQDKEGEGVEEGERERGRRRRREKRIAS